MNTRPIVVALFTVFAALTWMHQPPVAEQDSPTNPDLLGRVAKEWAYPHDNTLSIKPGIGRSFPMHVVVTQTNDSFDDVCCYYATKCGHKFFDEIDLRATGESEHGIYLIRDHRTDPRAEVPRVIFMHHNKNHTVSVTVMRPARSSRTQVDLSVSVR